MAFEWGTACRPKSGQSVSGDTFVIEPFADEQLLVGLIDGLGGGEEAALAANAAAEVFRAHPTYTPTDLLQQAHVRLHSTRGAVAALLVLSGGSRQAIYVGVGNIGAQVYSTQSIKPISKNGILGYRMPQLLTLRYTYNSGDTFVLFSDGVSSRFALETTLDSSAAPQELANILLHNYGKTTDDATVVVVRAFGECLNECRSAALA
ncbi:SpoIIE family protein phosphatase [Candidatus Gracilibacteria bacterium]|nr:SpoIIE family protein phosphatase [Candidatus Gracilibacteria bacterium]